MDVADIIMLDSRCGLGFVNETFPGLRITGQLWREKFKCNRSLQLRILGFIHHTHSAFTYLFKDFIVGNCFADHISYSNCQDSLYPEPILKDC